MNCRRASQQREDTYDVVTRNIRVAHWPTRRCLVQSPAGKDLSSAAVIIDLHGSGMSAAEQVRISDSSEMARRGAVIVTPDAAIPFALFDGQPPGTAWNVPGTPLPGESKVRSQVSDVDFIDDLIDQLVARHHLDRRRLHVRGFSGGARLASQLPARSRQRFASVGCVAGLRSPPRGRERPPPLLALHGLLDRLNPIAGGSALRWREPVPDAAAEWGERAGAVCSVQTSLAATAEEVRHIRKDGSTAAKLIIINDIGHSWPGTNDAEHLRQFGPSGTFAASDAYWDFVCSIDRYNDERDIG